MLAIALRRCRIFPVPPGEGLQPESASILLAELTKLGFELDAPERVIHGSPALLVHWPVLFEELKRLRGADVAHVPLFSEFPASIPDDRTYLLQRILGRFGLHTFDTSKFGADPITQLQNPELYAHALAQQATASSGDRQPIPLEVVEWDAMHDRLQAWLEATLRARSSIPEAQHADVSALLETFGTSLTLDEIGQRETGALVLAHFWTAGALDTVTELARTPTDVLRMFAVLTQTDVSLTEGVKFPRFTRPQRRAILTVLEAAPRLAEDLLRYEGLWKAVCRSIHSGEYATRFPKAHAAVQALRHGRLTTFASTTEFLLAQDSAEVLVHLASRPGEFARALHRLLRVRPPDAVLEAFARIAPQVPAKILLSLHSHFSTIDAAEKRAVVTKKGRVKVLPNPHQGTLGDPLQHRVVTLLETALRAQFAEKESWAGKRVWIDPELENITVPLQLRTALDGLIHLGRGSWMAVPPCKVLRLFVWWKQTARDTDLDLSAISFDESWGYLGHVSFTALSGQGMAHSGDLQSAPLGATEYIDLKLDALDPKVRYIAPQIHRYAGERFDQCTAHGGWMARDTIDMDVAAFDPASVVDRYDLSGFGSYALPFVVDVKQRRVLVMDLFVGSRAFSTAEASTDAVSHIAKQVAHFVETRPTLATLARLHIEARGAQLVPFEQADLTFASGGDFDPQQPEVWLSELL